MGQQEREVILMGKVQGSLLLQRGKAALVANRVSVLNYNFLKMYHFLSWYPLRLVTSTGSPEAKMELVFVTSYLLQRLICCYACQHQMSARAIDYGWWGPRKSWEEEAVGWDREGDGEVGLERVTVSNTGNVPCSEGAISPHTVPNISISLFKKPRYALAFLHLHIALFWWRFIYIFKTYALSLTINITEWFRKLKIIGMRTDAITCVCHLRKDGTLNTGQLVTKISLRFSYLNKRRVSSWLMPGIESCQIRTAQLGSI